MQKFASNLIQSLRKEPGRWREESGRIVRDDGAWVRPGPGRLIAGGVDDPDLSVKERFLVLCAARAWLGLDAGRSSRGGGEGA